MKNKFLPIKRLVKFLISSTIFLIIIAILFILNNNYGDTRYSIEDLKLARQASANWLLTNRDIILQEHNAILWWMLKQGSQQPHDDKVLNLFNEYKKVNFDFYSRSPWSYLILDVRPQIDVNALLNEEKRDDNLLFIYGMTCHSLLGQEPAIKRQLDQRFCANQQPVLPACTTHQLLGIQFMQENNCGDKEQNAMVSEILLKTIKTQLTLDFRVVDVYLQRNLMLAKSGKFESIRKRWIKRILNAQLRDGGWQDFQPLIPVNNTQYFGFRFAIRENRSSFHATAQGYWLMSMLIAAHEPKADS